MDIQAIGGIGSFQQQAAAAGGAAPGGGGKDSIQKLERQQQQLKQQLKAVKGDKRLGKEEKEARIKKLQKQLQAIEEQIKTLRQQRQPDQAGRAQEAPEEAAAEGAQAAKGTPPTAGETKGNPQAASRRQYDTFEHAQSDGADQVGLYSPPRPAAEADGAQEGRGKKNRREAELAALLGQVQ